MRNSRTDISYQGLGGDNSYFLWFTDIVIPTSEEIEPQYDQVPEQEIYRRSDVDPLRQIVWHAKTILNNQEVSISKSSIPGFRRVERNSPGYERFVKDEAVSDLAETKILVDGITQFEGE